MFLQNADQYRLHSGDGAHSPLFDINVVPSFLEQVCDILLTEAEWESISAVAIEHFRAKEGRDVTPSIRSGWTGRRSGASTSSLPTPPASASDAGSYGRSSSGIDQEMQQRIRDLQEQLSHSRLESWAWSGLVYVITNKGGCGR